MKIIGFKAFLIAVLLAALSIAAFAQKEGLYSHEDAGIQFTVPEGWDVEAEGDLVIVGPADGQVGVMLMVVEVDTMEAAAGALDDYLAKTLTDQEVTDETKEIKVNGLDAFTSAGRGKLEGTPVNFMVMIVLGKKPLLVFGAVETANMEKHKKQINDLMQSIGPIK